MHQLFRASQVRHRATREQLPAVYFYKVNAHANPDIFGDSLDVRLHTFATRDWDSRCAHKSTTVCVSDNILCEELFQSGHVSFLRGRDKGFQKAPLLV